MLRFKILASSVPLLLAVFFARGGLIPVSQPCITIGETSVQLATVPWQAQVNVAFTDDPSRATVRVRIVETPETADFAVADDVDNAETGCGATTATRLIGITSDAGASGPVIYLTHHDEDADFRIYVRSKSVTPRDAAALLVGADVASGNGGERRIAQAAL